MITKKIVPNNEISLLISLFLLKKFIFIFENKIYNHFQPSLKYLIEEFGNNFFEFNNFPHSLAFI